jgi:hypothetical protein
MSLEEALKRIEGGGLRISVLVSGIPFPVTTAQAAGLARIAYRCGRTVSVFTPTDEQRRSILPDEDPVAFTIYWMEVL